MPIPFLDLDAAHRPLRKELDAAIAEVINVNAFAGGPFVERFELDFARFCRADIVIGLGNGTDALWLALLALGVGPGDEVITVPNTFIATAEAISFVGAKPVFVDIDPVTYTLDPNRLEQAITPKTAAIIPVHIFGQAADMDPIMAIAANHKIPVVEDACQAHGAEYKGRPVGTIGEVGCFSFYPGKNLGAFGEAGAAITNRPDLAQKMKTLRDHGQSRKYYHQLVGWNCRMDGIQGAVLQVKLKHLARSNELRRANAAIYNGSLNDEVIKPEEAAYARHVYHLYVIRTRQRDQVMEGLAKRKIGSGIHYPVPLHLQEAYAFLGYKKGDFPVSERSALEFLSLPMFPELTAGQIAEVVANLSEVLEELAPEKALAKFC